MDPLVRVDTFVVSWVSGSRLVVGKSSCRIELVLPLNHGQTDWVPTHPVASPLLGLLPPSRPQALRLHDRTLWPVPKTAFRMVLEKGSRGEELD